MPARYLLGHPGGTSRHCYDRDMPASPTATTLATAHAPESDLSPCRVKGLQVALTAMNSARTLAVSLASVASLAERVVVVDSGSTDGSVDLARSFGAEVLHKPWSGHVLQKQAAVDQCQGAAWIILLDSDEALDGRLQDAIRAGIQSATADLAGFRVNRRLVLHGRALRHAFQPEWRVRVFRAGRGRIAGVPPHDRVDVDGAIATLTGDLLHHSWEGVDDMLRRQLNYARIHASEPICPQGGRAFDVMVRPIAAFLKQYAWKQGFRDGWRGLVASGGAAAATLMKHLALVERRALEHARDRRDGRGP